MQVPSESITSQWLAFLTPLAIAFLAVVQYMTSNRAAKHAEVVKTTLELTNKEVAAATAKGAQRLDQIHILVNSERGTLLEMYAASQEALATLLKTPESIAAAKVARGMVEDHKKKQEMSDTNDLDWKKNA